MPIALSYDEMALSKNLEYDQAEQRVYGPYSQVQVAMIRGLFKNFKQAVFYDFDKPMTKEILGDIMDKLDRIGFRTEVIVSDMGSKNLGLWKDLGIQPGNVSFSHGDRKVQAVADVPHLLKLLRNHLLDQGFILNDESLLRRGDVEALLQVNEGELKVNHKLKPLHFNCKGSQRQDVRLAAQVSVF